MTNNNNNPRAAAVPSALDADLRDPESVWLSRVRAIYNPRAYRWVEQVRDTRRRATRGGHKPQD